ncbi:hypothetical protein E1180_19415 [Roseibium denhamense]|uniref:hypothetical protein n=1 Tax=Roseibium denhamense TaxID=76305 RepID=UPI0012BC5AED|nr:hypothetical protein [Roseibium denhamense]MTI07675.1 hypothetical protein [Roseibium denhamense]
MKALVKTLKSNEFQSAPQLQAFLSFVVHAALDKRMEQIKGYTIAVEALGRSPDFNPVTDPIVRVEAARLRRRLDRYYAGTGVNDQVRIYIPKGSYAPVFNWACEKDLARSRPAKPLRLPVSDPEPEQSPQQDSQGSSAFETSRSGPAILETAADATARSHREETSALPASDAGPDDLGQRIPLVPAAFIGVTCFLAGYLAALI